MAGRTIEVSHIPFIPNKQLLIDFLEDVLGNGCVRTCKLKQSGIPECSSSNWSETEGERQVSAVVETESAESAMALHDLAKAGILVFWCATLAVKFVSCSDSDHLYISNRKVHDAPSNPEICVSRKKSSMKDPVRKADVFVPKLAPDTILSEPKQLSEPRVSVPEVVHEPKPETGAKYVVPGTIFGRQFDCSSKPAPDTHISKPKVLHEPKNLSESRVSVPEERVHEPKPETGPKYFVAKIFERPSVCRSKPVLDTNISKPKVLPEPKQLSEPRVSVPEVVQEAKPEPRPKSCVPVIFGQQFACSRNIAESKAGKGSRDLPRGKSIQVVLEGLALHIGCETSEKSFYVLSSFKAVVVDFASGDWRITLFVSEGSMEYKMELGYADIHYIHRHPATSTDYQILLLRLRHAPRIYSNMCSSSQSDDNRYNCKDSKTAQWVRTTDFTQCHSIGQSSSFCLELPIVKDISHIQNKFAHYKEVEYKLFLEHGRPLSSPSNLVPIIYPPEGFHLPYQIMFKINSLVQQGILSWPSLDNDIEFFKLLQPERRPVARINEALTKLGKSGWKTCYRPVDWISKQLDISNSHLHSEGKCLDNGMIEVNRVLVTPTKVYFCEPELEISNRVTRHFINYIENFLRVSFVDENRNTLSPWELSTWMGNEAPRKQTKVYERILSVLKEGIVIGDKRFEFLAFSSSQLRDGSLWMFASTGTINADHIRNWMGNFQEIKIVAKCAARMGQSFSSSTETVDVPTNEFECILDIKTDCGRYTFSDGIGKISPSFAEEVARKCECGKKTPSAFQIRYAGYKGVVAVCPRSTSKLSLRPSMRKYTSNNISFDVLAWTRYGPCFLNRQIIILLSTLGVEDRSFEKLQKQAMAQLDQLMTSRDQALEVLENLFSGESHRHLKDMLSCGYCPNSEPYLSMMLQAFRTSKIQDLKCKARIFVPKGSYLMGCLDETGTLNYGEVFIQISSARGKKQFHGAENASTSVVEGKVVVAKNPCLHPGDIRILLAVNTPKLHHMVDCLVFPQRGNRPHPDECSGGDLDGDCYTVIWDESLIPPQQFPPMEYNAKPPKELDHIVTIEDIQEHFVNHMTTDTLGSIDNSHLAFADQELEMARSPKCLKLAELHSIAVDFPKTGVVAKIPQELHPKKYPDFMEKEDKETYESTKILGKLYRSLQEHVQQRLLPISHFADKAYDKDLEIMGYDRYLKEAFAYKTKYDSRLVKLMNHYGIKNEAEIVSGNFESLSNFVGSNKRHGTVKETITAAMKSLKREARGWFELQDGCSDVNEGTKKTTMDRKNAKASAWYYVTYHPSYWGRGDLDSINSAHLISFPWVLVDVLLNIKKTR